MTRQTAGQASPIRVAAGDGLVAVDVQNDFLPGGPLAVPGGDRVVPALNRYLNLFAERSLPIFATRDWHPADHCSFRGRLGKGTGASRQPVEHGETGQSLGASPVFQQGGQWPPHCVANTPGAAFAPALALPPSTVVVSKGTDPRQEAYSGFQGTNLAEQIREAKVRRLFVGGLATEFCVMATVRDALSEGFAVFLLLDAIQALEIEPGDARRSEQEMIARGALGLRWEEVA